MSWDNVCVYVKSLTRSLLTEEGLHYFQIYRVDLINGKNFVYNVDLDKYPNFIKGEKRRTQVSVTFRTRWGILAEIVVIQIITLRYYQFIRSSVCYNVCVTMTVVILFRRSSSNILRRGFTIPIQSYWGRQVRQQKKNAARESYVVNVTQIYLIATSCDCCIVFASRWPWPSQPIS